ncbi:MAG: type IV pilus assembly protein PilM [Janthinobacterium lividum]
MLGLTQVFGKEKVVGVDIGSRFMKVVQAEAGRTPGSWRIGKAAIAPTPQDAVRDGIVMDQAAVAEALRALLADSGIDANAVVAAISGTSVIVRHVKLPKMPESVLRKSVRFEAAKHISSSVDDSVIEFEITGNVPGEDDKMSVMLVAAPNDMVQSRLSMLTLAGLEPIAIDVEAFALQRALVDLSPTRPGEGTTLALLDIGATTTDVNIIANGLFALTRNIPIAGDSFTQAIKAVAPGADWAELERLKTEVDMAVLLQNETDSQAAILAHALQPAIDELLREVRRSTNYYQSQLADTANSILPAGTTSQTSGPVGKIVITGGSAKMRGLEAYMSARLGVPVEIWNPFQNPELDTTQLHPDFIEQNHPFLVTGIGLALKELSLPPVHRAEAVSARPKFRNPLAKAA